MYRDYPHKGEIMRTFQNIQEVEKMEDMGGSMPSIYSSLDIKQVEYLSSMIEVEGNLDNQPIEVLIVFGAIHSYINSNIVEIFH